MASFNVPSPYVLPTGTPWSSDTGGWDSAGDVTMYPVAPGTMGPSDAPGFGQVAIEYNRNGVQQFKNNDRVDWPIPIKIDTSVEGVLLDNEIGHFTFIRTGPETRGSGHSGGGAYLTHHAYQAKNLSRLNRYLESQEGRNLYGKNIDCKPLLDDWKLAGVLQTKLTQEMVEDGVATVNMHVGQRVRVPALACNLGDEPRDMDSWHLMCRRYEYTPYEQRVRADLKFNPKTIVGIDEPMSVFSAGQQATLSSLQRQINERAMGRKGLPFDTMQLVDDIAVSEPESKLHMLADTGLMMDEKSTLSKDKPKEHYWRFDFWVGSRTQKPPESLYLVKGAMIGETISLGIVTGVFGKWDKAACRSAAKDALYPPDDTEYYKQRCIDLGFEVELQLRIR